MVEEIKWLYDDKNNDMSEWYRILEELTKKETLDLLTNPSRNKIYVYLNEAFLSLRELYNAPELFGVSIKLFNNSLRSLITNVDTRKILLSWKKWTKMFVLRDEILVNFQKVIDKDIAKKLKKYTIDEEIKEEYENDDDEI